MKLLTVVGARPQFIKASALSRAIRNSTDFEEVLVHTGQHYDENMSEVFFRELDMSPPAHSLGIGGGRHGEMTGEMIAAIERLLLEERPDVLVIYGDTNSTLAGAVAAAKLNVPIAHVEAGLRSFNRRMPEEINRVLADHVSNWLLCPTDTAVGNLATEGIRHNVFNVGDIMYDVALQAGERATQSSQILEELALEPREYVLATVHRQENTDSPDRLRSIVDGLGGVGAVLPVVLPLHPRTRARLAAAGIELAPSVRVINPVGYLDMVRLEANSALVATDSGGVQKEAFFYRVPCVTLRQETEWSELVESGWNRVVDPLSANLADQIVAGLNTSGAPDAAFFGHGNTAERILDVLRQ